MALFNCFWLGWRLPRTEWILLRRAHASSDGLHCINSHAKFSMLFCLGWSQRFKPGQIQQCIRPRVAAHFLRSLQAAADRRPIGMTEYFAMMLLIQLDTTFACRFTVRHAGNRRWDRRGDTARAAPAAAMNRLRRLVYLDWGHDGLVMLQL